MADFFKKIADTFSTVTNMFKTKDLDSNITLFQSKMDTIITDLLIPFAKPTTLASKDRFRDLVNLLDPKYCNKIALTLSSNLDKNYTNLQLEQFASSILVGKEMTECKDEECTNNAEKTINNKKKTSNKKNVK